MQRSAPVDGFSLAYERHGSGAPVVLLHGWPGDHGDWREVVARLDGGADVVVPDLRGFGASDRHLRDPAQAYSAAAQAASVVGLIGELGLGPAVIAGYDVGSRVALGLSEEIIDGRQAAVRAHLEHFWSHWSGPGFTPSAAELDRLTVLYGAPGAFVASIGWYRAGAGTIARSLGEQAPGPDDRIALPTTVLWPEHDPLFPPAWSDRLDEFFSSVALQLLPGAGHFSPLEAPDRFTQWIQAAL